MSGKSSSVMRLNLLSSQYYIGPAHATDKSKFQFLAAILADPAYLLVPTPRLAHMQLNPPSLPYLADLTEIKFRS